MEEDINKLIEELTNVRPDELSIEGLKLFNKINEIIDINKELKEKNSLLIQQNITYKRNINDLKHNNIPVSLVEEKIEERKLWLSSNDIGYKDDYVLEVLQELLEKR